MPSAVRKKAAEADALIEAQTQGPARVDLLTSEPEQDEVTNDPVAEADAPDTPAEDQGADEPKDFAAQLHDEAQKWEQRYRSLDGQLRARDQQINQLRDIIAAMQAAPAPQVETAEALAEGFVTPQDDKDFGSDLVDMARRAARTELAQLERKVQSLIDKLEGKLSTVETSVQAAAAESFEDKLTRLVPNWKVLNYDPDFIEWLQGSNARNQVFAAAAKMRDADGVAEFFQEYTKKAAPVTMSNKEKLERQVAPGKSKAAPRNARAEEPKTWTRSEISALYTNKGRYNKEEFSRLERDMFKAQSEGRVDMNR